MDVSFVGIIKSHKREIYKTRSITMEIVKGHFHGNHGSSHTIILKKPVFEATMHLYNKPCLKLNLYR